MKTLTALIALVLCAARLGAQASLPKYPPAVRGAQSDDLNGVRVADPYRWLENLSSPEVRTWITAENAATEAFIAQTPRRKEIRDLVRRAWDTPRTGVPFAGGDRLFYYQSDGLENQPVLYVQDRTELSPRVLIDPNTFSPEGLIAIVDQSPAPDGKYLAYAVSKQGSAWRTVRIRDVRTTQDLTDELQGIKDSPLAWTRDTRGFFYIRSDAGRAALTTNPLAPDGRQQVFYHRLGRPQTDDRLMYENAAHPEWRLHVDVSDDGQYLVIAARVGTDANNRLYLIDLDNPGHPNLAAPLVTLFDGADALYEFAGSADQLFFIRTTRHAPRGRLVAVDINMPDEDHWTTVVRETYDPLIAAHRADDRIVAHRLHDARSVLELYGFDGGLRGIVPLPGLGTVTEISGRESDREFYFGYTSFLQPMTIFRYSSDARAAAPFRNVRPDTALADFETTQLFFTAKDGTRVPMFITARRGLPLDGSHPAILAASGVDDGGVGFNAVATPEFSPRVAAWLQLGGIYAVANVRGGWEYGRAWQESGIGHHTQVSIDDFLSAAEFLVDRRYTKTAFLSIAGRGTGGVLVGAALTQRPELFAAAWIDAGVFDMTRFNRFTVGASWIPEFGSPDRPDDLRVLLAYSPLQNVRAGTRFPATLLTVGDHDEVVTPAHSLKFAAALQWAQAAPAPVLLHVVFDAGFGPGTPTAMQIARDTDVLSFLSSALHLSR